VCLEVPISMKNCSIRIYPASVNTFRKLIGEIHVLKCAVMVMVYSNQVNLNVYLFDLC
jgi:hypothetical protein